MEQPLTVVLTGGRSTRMGGRHKPAMTVDGRSVVDRVISAAPTDAIVVAGSAEGISRDVTTVREDPPFAGPLAGIAAALEAVPAVPTRVVLILGGDMPFLDAGFLRGLVARAPAIARDESGRTQFLCAAWPEALLRTRLGALGDVTGVPVRRLYESGDTTPIDAPPGTLRDIDTPDDLPG